jgi:hypothetical protein
MKAETTVTVTKGIPNTHLNEPADYHNHYMHYHICCLCMGIDIRFASFWYFSESEIIVRQIRDICVVCQSSRLLRFLNPFQVPPLATRERMNVLEHNIFISARKSLLVLLYTLIVGVFLECLSEYFFRPCVPQLRTQRENLNKESWKEPIRQSPMLIDLY